MSTLETGWELSKKHLFVLSASGKPIFSRIGDEQEIVTTFGLLQAIISIVLDCDDAIQCMKAGDRKIVFFAKNSLYFVAMTFTNEPEIILMKQLQFLYSQILFAVTAKIHDVLLSNPSCDIRQLLGVDTSRLMHSSCDTVLCPNYVSFECLPSFICKKVIRDEITAELKSCVDNAGAALGILLQGDKLLAYITNQTTSLSLGTADVVLLAHFVANSSSLKTQDQHWIPICLPDFNESGYLQSYVCNLRTNNSEGNKRDFSLVFVAASSDSEEFKTIHRARLAFEEVVCSARPTSSTIDESFKSLSLMDNLSKLAGPYQTKSVDKFLRSSSCIHFFFKFRPFSTSNTSFLPAQYIASSMEDNITFTSEEAKERIWTHYQRLAVRVRRGACTAETSFFSPDSSLPSSSTLSGITSLGPHVSGERDGDHASAAARAMRPTVGGMSRLPMFPVINAVSGNLSEQESALQLEPDRLIADQFSQRKGVSNFLSELPAVEHALAYEVLSNGFVIVALANLEAEIFATFDGTLSALEACNKTDKLSRDIRGEYLDLFVAI